MKKFIILYSIFCIIVTFAIFLPYSRTITHALPNAIDPVFYVWNIQHNLRSVFGGMDTLLNTNIMYPETNTLAFSDTLFAQTVLTAPIIALTNNGILTENIYIFATFLFSALSMFFLAYFITRHIFASSLSGLFFAFSYPRLAQIGHMPMISSQWLPLTILFCLKYLKSKSWTHLILLYICYIGAITSSLYLGVFLLPFLFLAVKPSFKKFVVSFIPLFIILTIILYPYIRLKAENISIKRTLDDTGRFSAQLKDYVTILPTSTLARLNIFPEGINEKPLYPTVTLLVLAAVGLYAGRKSHKKYVLLFALSAFTAFVLSFGPDWKGIKLPYYYLYAVLPVLQAIRVPARLSIMVVLFLSVLAAIGISRIRPAKTARVVIIVALLVFFMEVWQEHTPSVPIPIGNTIPSVYRWLARTPNDVIIVELPFRLLWRGIPIDDQVMLTWDQTRDEDVLAVEAYRTYFSTYHNKRMLNGYSGFFPQSYLDQSGLLDNFPTPESMALLEQLHVRYILIHAWQYTDKKFSDVKNQIAQYPQLKFVAQFENDYVWEL